MYMYMYVYILCINVFVRDVASFHVVTSSPALGASEVKLATLIDVRATRILNVVEEEWRLQGLHTRGPLNLDIKTGTNTTVVVSDQYGQKKTILVDLAAMMK